MQDLEKLIDDLKVKGYSEEKIAAKFAKALSRPESLVYALEYRPFKKYAEIALLKLPDSELDLLVGAVLDASNMKIMSVIEKFGRRVLPALMRLFNQNVVNQQSPFRYAMINFISQFKSPEVADCLIHVLRQSHGYLEYTLVSRLSKMEYPQVKACLISLCVGSNHIRFHAIKVMGMSMFPEYADPIYEAWQKDQGAALVVSMALAQLGDERAWEIARTLPDTLYYRRHITVMTRQWHYSQTRRYYLELLQRPSHNEETANYLIKCMKWFDFNADEVPLFIDMLKNTPHRSTKCYTMMLLGTIGDPQVIPMLAEIYRKHPVKRVRYVAGLALRKIGTPEAQSIL